MNIQLSASVSQALANGDPVVALESTIISHGFPRPRNLEVGKLLEATVRQHGAVPATIAVLDGVAHVGLEPDQLERLALEDGIEKCSARDLPLVSAAGGSGATTVAATCHLAAMAGVKVFATGGIGGVHRHAERTMDVSADLRQLATSPVVVISAGAKSILDLGLTLEVLETYGVPVVGLGCDEMPAFYTRTSGHFLTQRVDDIETLAKAVIAQQSLGLTGGMLVCNPIPQEAALDADEVEGWIQAALAKAEAQGIAGKALTPFLLGELVERSGGQTLGANIALAKNNAQVGARLAVELCK